MACCRSTIEHMIDDTSNPKQDGSTDFPTEDDLPDDPLTPEDIDPFSVDTSDFDDINDFVAAELDCIEKSTDDA